MSNQMQNQHSFTEISNIAKAMFDSGFFKDTTDISKAIVKILAGQELGIPPFAAMSGINVIQGKPVLSAGLLASLVDLSGRYKYRVVEHNDKSCTLSFFESGQEIGQCSYTIEDAQKAGLATKDIWKKHTMDMLFARCISTGVRRYCPSLAVGGVYTPAELYEEDSSKAEKTPEYPLTTKPNPTPKPAPKPKPAKSAFTDKQVEVIRATYEHAQQLAIQKGFTKADFEREFGMEIADCTALKNQGDYEGVCDALEVLINAVTNFEFPNPPLGDAA